MNMNWRIIRALIIKYAFVCSRNTFRLLDVIFWPVMDLWLWGFVSIYMMKVNSALPAVASFLVGAIILSNVMYRAQQVVSVSFLDDVWARNLLNIFVAPVKASEYVSASCIMGLIQATFVLFLLSALAFACNSVNLFRMGWGLAFLFANLILMGWSMGMFATACVLRWGPPAEALAWAIPGLLQPISAVFYPVSVMPSWLRPVSLCVPATHVFEGMRQVLSGREIDLSHLWCAFGLNVIYMIVAALAFRSFLDRARGRGFLVKYAG
jgi:ABC-2 type transport system permease protein